MNILLPKRKKSVHSCNGKNLFFFGGGGFNKLTKVFSVLCWLWKQFLCLPHKNKQINNFGGVFESDNNLMRNRMM